MQTKQKPSRLRIFIHEKSRRSCCGPVLSGKEFFVGLKKRFRNQLLKIQDGMTNDAVFFFVVFFHFQKANYFHVKEVVSREPRARSNLCSPAFLRRDRSLRVSSKSERRFKFEKLPVKFASTNEPPSPEHPPIRQRDNICTHPTRGGGHKNLCETTEESRENTHIPPTLNTVKQAGRYDSGSVLKLQLHFHHSLSDRNKLQQGGGGDTCM